MPLVRDVVATDDPNVAFKVKTILFFRSGVLVLTYGK